MAKTGNNFFGFTLLELAMVCAILSLGGLIVFPRIQGAVFDWNRKAEAQKMRSVIRETQHRALTQQTSYRIEFQPITRKYDIQRDNSGTFETVETIDMLPHVYFMTTPVCEADTLEFDLMDSVVCYLFFWVLNNYEMIS